MSMNEARHTNVGEASDVWGEQPLKRPEGGKKEKLQHRGRGELCASGDGNAELEVVHEKNLAKPPLVQHHSGIAEEDPLSHARSVASHNPAGNIVP